MQLRPIDPVAKRRRMMLFANNGGSGLRQSLLDGAPFLAELTHTAVPVRAAPGTTATFTRATPKTVENNDGYLVQGLANEVMFPGARRVRNWIQAPTENWSSAGWVKSGISVSGNRLTATGANGIIYDNAALGMGTGRTAVGSVTLSRVTGTGNVDISTNGGTTWTTVSVTGARVSVSLIGNINGQFAIRIVTSGDAVDATYPQLEDVTAQTTQTAGEYVSVGVESAPYYHGSMVDGVKCFGTDLSGNPLPTEFTYDAVSLPGVAGSYVSTPDSAAASITGDIDIRARYSGDWSPSAVTVWGGKFLNPGQYSWRVYTDTSGTIWHFQYSLDGTNAPEVNVTATAPFADNTTGWWRVTRASATGYVNFYTSVDGVTWTPLGTQQTSTAGSLYNGTDPVQFGTSAFPLTGKIYQGQIYNGINGTLAVDFDASRYAGGTTLTGSTGETWTLQGNAVIHPTNSPNTGYLAEGARTNLCLQSQTFDNASWTKAAGGGASVPVVTADQGVAPDGTTTADKVVFVAPVSGDISELSAAPATGAGTYTGSIYIKAFAAGDVGKIIGFRNVAGVTYTLVTLTTAWQRVSSTEVRVANNIDITLRPSEGTSAGTVSVYLWGAQVELGSSASTYIATTTAAVTRAADVDSVPTASNILAAASTVYLEFTPDHTPSGTIALWGTYVDASNYTAILHDATNMIMRKRIAGVNYDATIANAFSANTTYKVCGSWGASGVTVTVNGTEGTPHANTTAAQIAATMQWGADGNSLQQPFATERNARVWQRQLSASERGAITA